MYSNLPSSRAAALAAGAKKYFTGQPCENGHVTYRYTQNWGCSACALVRAAVRRKRASATRRARNAPEMRRNAALAEMKWIDVAAHPHHVARIRKLAEGLMQKRYPFLPKREAWRKFNAGFVHGVMSHPYHVHPADAMYLREQATLTLI